MGLGTRRRQRAAAPVDDELLGFRVQVSIAKRRRVHRVEQLLQLADMDVEPLGARRQRVAYGVLFRWHVHSPVMRCQEAAVRRSG